MKDKDGDRIRQFLHEGSLYQVVHELARHNTYLDAIGSGIAGHTLTSPGILSMVFWKAMERVRQWFVVPV